MAAEGAQKLYAACKEIVGEESEFLSKLFTRSVTFYRTQRGSTLT